MGDQKEQHNKQTLQTDSEAILDRVNQTFDKIAQDVKNMISDNNQDANNQEY